MPLAGGTLGEAAGPVADVPGADGVEEGESLPHAARMDGAAPTVTTVSPACRRN